jgi:hypothetical protein
VIINRHNYEELFLMYVDNELTPAQRAEVDAFVHQNQDLADELKMLQQVTLMPEEEIQFDAKHLLYKKEEGISLANYEEYFLLDVDNELDESEKDEVEKFVLQHPRLQEDYTLLHRTKLDPETTTFENKKVLYRREERRVVPMRWMRMAAAAVVIGIAGVLYITIPGKDASVINRTNVASNGSSTQPKQVEKVDKVQSPEANNKVEEQEVAQTGKEKMSAAIKTEVSPVIEKAIVKKQTALPTAQNSNVAAVTKPETKAEVKTNDLPVRVNSIDVAVNNDNHNNQDHGLAANIDNRNPNSNTIAEPTHKVIAAARVKDDKEQLMKQAVYREVGSNEEEENIVLIGSAQINKNKLRGLLKKASGLFGKKGDKNEHQKSILIAGFEVKS